MQTQADFDVKWEAGEIEGWEETKQPKAQVDANGNGSEGIWCSACKYRTNYSPHTSSRRHHIQTTLILSRRSKDVLQANSIRCPLNVQKAHQSVPETVHRRTTTR